MQLQPDGLIQVQTETGGEQLRSEVALLERAMHRCEWVLTAMARLNIEDRLVKLSHAQAQVVNGVILGAFADIGLSREMQEAARSAIVRRRRLAAAEEGERLRRELEPD